MPPQHGEIQKRPTYSFGLEKRVLVGTALAAAAGRARISGQKKDKGHIRGGAPARGTGRGV